MIIHFDITGGGTGKGRDFESAWDKGIVLFKGSSD